MAVEELTGMLSENRFRIVFRRDGRFATMMPTQTSLMLQILRSMAPHIISCDLRNLAVMGILATESPVPLA